MDGLVSHGDVGLRGKVCEWDLGLVGRGFGYFIVLS